MIEITHFCAGKLLSYTVLFLSENQIQNYNFEENIWV